jgi:hypothetical protein
MTTLAYAEDIAAELNAAGVRTVTDPRSVAPPCVLLQPPTEVVFDIGCAGTAQMRALLLVGGPANRDWWHTTDALLGVVVPILQPQRAAMTAIQIDDGGDISAVELTWTATVRYQ